MVAKRAQVQKVVAVDVPSAAEPADSGSDAVLRQFALLLDALACGAMLLHRSGEIVYVNRRLCDMMQRSCGELIGRPLFDLYRTAPSREFIQESLDHFGESRQQEFFVPRSDGVDVPVIVAGRVLQGPPPLNDHAIVTIIDISPLKNVERELQERYREVASLTDTVIEQAVELKRHSDELERRVHQRTLELRKANMESIYMLAIASEAKDEFTGAHVRRIERLTRLLALELGLPEHEAEQIGYSSILHDVGKIHIPDQVLQKPGTLTEDEWRIMREHTTFGERILSREPFFATARSIARSHHENWNGTGYPDGERDVNIPLAARIVRVADVFDALTTVRPYKPAWNEDEAAKHITQERGILFDPEVVGAFVTLYRSGRLDHRA